MHRRTFLRTLTAGVAASALPRIAGAAAAPFNILFILTDDLGWHDLGPYGNKIHRHAEP